MSRTQNALGVFLQLFLAAVCCGPVTFNQSTAHTLDEPPNCDCPQQQPGEIRQVPPMADHLPPESVEADISVRSVAVGLGFVGSEVMVFGSVRNSRQTSAESGYYDVVIALEGAAVPIAMHRKSYIAGLWLNTQSLVFDRVPSFYALASTRGIEEVADPRVLGDNAIGFQYLRMRPRDGEVRTYSDAELRDWRDAAVRLKQKESLFAKSEYGVSFIGRGLFRTSINLPPNIPAGSLTAHVYLFHEGNILSHYASRVNIERVGLVQVLHSASFTLPMLFALMLLGTTVAIGLLAYAVFRRVGP